MRFLVVGLAVTLAGFVALAVASGRSAPVEESVATPDVTPTPALEQTPTAPTEPTPTPLATPTAVAESAVAEVANTGGSEVEGASDGLVSEYFVPSYVGAVDRTEYDAAVSAELATPAPEPTPTAHSNPDPTPIPAATAQPTPESTESPRADPEPTPEPEPTSTPDDDDDDSGGGPTASQWAALRQCESGGNYSIVSGNGLYHGAYQFHQNTWDNVASGAWPELVGVDPADASPADQDKMAVRLYDLSGPGPWPVCGQHLI